MRTTTGKAKTLSGKDYKTLLSRIEIGRHPERNRMIIILSFKLGLRAKELSLLKIGDVFQDGKVVDVLKLDKHTKNEKKRELPLSSPAVKTAIVEYMEYYAEQYPLHHSAKYPFFRTQRKTAFVPNRMVECIKNIYKAAGFENCSSHSGRRSFITELANKNIDLNSIRVLAGHTSITTTQIYIDENPAMLADIMRGA